ncbi:MAG: CoB--CoM heterodisulfide reductase subunit B, partial [Euryarchaeota archaeon]|nr:CoB--CoM heterodisulfide reductase subunit B [Euryarchaeota archaeon]
MGGSGLRDEYYLFKGCLIPTRLPFLERSSLLVLESLEIAHTSLPGATCCVEPIGLRSLALDTWLVVAARMLSIAEEGGRDILTLCNGCYVSLKEARHLLQSREERERVNAVLSEIGREYRGKGNVEHLAGLVRRKRSEIQSLTVAPLDKLRIAPHSGCHSLRPSTVTAIDASFSPRVLTEVARWVGAEAVAGEEWPKCCGGGVAGIDDGL